MGGYEGVREEDLRAVEDAHPTVYLGGVLGEEVLEGEVGLLEEGG